MKIERSVGSMTSWMRAIEVTESEPSLTLPSMAMCEWQSMIPGVTNLPVPSTTVAVGDAFTSLPTSAILPFRISTEPFSIVPCVIVMTVALRIRISFAGAVCVSPVTGWPPIASDVEPPPRATIRQRPAAMLRVLLIVPLPSAACR